MAKNMREARSAFHGFMKLLRTRLFSALLVSIFLVVPGQTAFAQDTGSITGTVRGPGGTPVAGANINASGPAGPGYATSAADGTYTISGLTPARNGLSASGNGLVMQYYNHASDYLTAIQVTVSSGGTTSGIDFDLAVGGTITGTVRGPGGTPVSGVYAIVYPVSGTNMMPSGYSMTAADGTYTITGLPAGSYLVASNGGGSGLSAQYYNNADSTHTATAVTVTIGGTTSGIDFNLAAGGTITGTVRGPGGTPISGVPVFARSSMNDQFAGLATTAADGTYTITGLFAGSYWVASSASGIQYYNNTDSTHTATAVTVTSGGTTSNINFNTVAGGTITGTVMSGGTPIEYASISATNTATGGVVSSQSATDGTYTITTLPVGSYLVHSSYYAQFYNQAYSSSAATPVKVTNGGTTPNINFNLVPAGGTIQGRIMLPSGVPCPSCHVYIYDAASRSEMKYQLSLTASQNDGSYQTALLPAGNYKVAASSIVMANLGMSRDYYWPAATNIDSALLVPVTTGSATPNINIEITPFIFTDQTGVARSTVVTSNSIYAWWISADATASISITGGEYSVNGGAYTSAPGTVSGGNSVKVRQTSSSSYGTTTNATLTMGGISDTFSFTTLANTPPVITTPPTGGIQGTGITINGSNFGAVQGGSYVDFNGVQGTVGYWSDTQIVVIVPSGATSGSLRVVTSHGGASSNMSFTVYPPECAAPVKVGGSNYFTIQDAYNHAATGSTVQITEGLFNTGNLEFNRDISTRVYGGYNCGFDTKTGYSTVDGTVTIKAGSVTVEGLIIK